MVIITYLAALFVAVIVFYFGYHISDPLNEEDYMCGWLTGIIMMTFAIAVIAFFLSIGG